MGVAMLDKDEIYITESKNKDSESKFSAEIVNSFTNQVIDVLRDSKINKKE